jgi:ABC-2 type transport system ATP-binding protein
MIQSVASSLPLPEVRVRAIGGSLVRFAGVTKSFRGAVAVRDLDLDIGEGEVVALLGRNGAGKSTTIHLMLGLLRPSAGRVTVAGGDPTDARVRAGIGAMLQDGRLSGILKVRELVAQFSAYYPRPLPYREIVARANLAGLEDKRYGRLSGGEQKRVQFAIAICGDPRVVYLDEPTANMDVETRRGLHACIRALADEGRSVVFATHHLEEADALASRVILLDQGRLIRDGSPTAIKNVVAHRRASLRTSLSEAAVRALPGVTSALRVEDRLEIQFATGAPVARELYRLDPELTDLTIERADLEEAFLALVGPAAAAGPAGPAGKEAQS